jgi:hypothetical protein
MNTPAYHVNVNGELSHGTVLALADHGYCWYRENDSNYPTTVNQNHIFTEEKDAIVAAVKASMTSLEKINTRVGEYLRRLNPVAKDT